MLPRKNIIIECSREAYGLLFLVIVLCITAENDILRVQNITSVAINVISKNRKAIENLFRQHCHTQKSLGHISRLTL